MAEQQTRTEKDSLGEVLVPAQAYWGAQTQRAVENFPISGYRLGRRFVRALGLIKHAAACVNEGLGRLDGDRAIAIRRAAREVIDGQLDDHFVVDVFQTGSGTSTNMNANEVLANRAGELIDHAVPIHPNDHVNLGQSSNDVIPTALHVSAAEALKVDLLPALAGLREALDAKARQFDHVLKIGRTHLQDATPIRLGQVFSGYAAQTGSAARRVEQAIEMLCPLAIGGTAVGTGVNTHPDFARQVAEEIARETGIAFVEADNHFEAQAGKDAVCAASGQVRSVAAALTKIANDIRLLASGPRCGLGELRLPATQPGSSIMPGKVNPVMCEMVIQVAAQVYGYDAAIAMGCRDGQFELNTMMPMMAYNLLESIRLLSNAARTFTDRCVAGIEANEDRCRELIEQSLAMCTALAPIIGYDRAAAIAKEAHETGRTVREIARAHKVLDEAKLNEVLDARSMTEPA